MNARDRETFQRYLRSIPDDLLISVTNDCAWLAEALADDPVSADYRSRAAACLDEEQRRGWPQLLKRSRRYSPATENSASGAHAASAGGNWLTSPILAKSVPIPQ
jgi:hypothetical protein